MKLLFDQNISYRLLKKIEDVFPFSNQVRNLGLENASDLEIWKYAKKENFTIVTFDSDFYDLGLMYGSPPKIIWLRTGNLTTQNIDKLLRKMQDKIYLFVDSTNYKEKICLEIIDTEFE